MRLPFVLVIERVSLSFARRILVRPAISAVEMDFDGFLPSRESKRCVSKTVSASVPHFFLPSTHAARCISSPRPETFAHPVLDRRPCCPDKASPSVPRAMAARECQMSRRANEAENRFERCPGARDFDDAASNERRASAAPRSLQKRPWLPKETVALF
mgnify:CR=1 FL=1